MHFGLNPGPLERQYSTLIRVTRGKSYNLKGFGSDPATGYCGFATIAISISTPQAAIPAHFEKKPIPGARSLTRTLASDNSITEDAPVGNELTSSLEQAERVDHQLVHGI